MGVWEVLVFNTWLHAEPIAICIPSLYAPVEGPPKRSNH